MTNLFIEIFIGDQKLNFVFTNNEKGQKQAEKKVKEIIAGVFDMAAHKYSKELRQLSNSWKNRSRLRKLKSMEQEYLTKNQLVKPCVRYNAYYN
jgi:hypothetical protein